jgi:hypothetical protein
LKTTERQTTRRLAPRAKRPFLVPPTTDGPVPRRRVSSEQHRKHLGLLALRAPILATLLPDPLLLCADGLLALVDLDLEQELAVEL